MSDWSYVRNMCRYGHVALLFLKLGHQNNCYQILHVKKRKRDKMCQYLGKMHENFILICKSSVLSVVALYEKEAHLTIALENNLPLSDKSSIKVKLYNNGNSSFTWSELYLSTEYQS